MRAVIICIIYLVQIHLALTKWWDGNTEWNYAPPYFVPYVSESGIQYGQPVMFGPPQDCPNYSSTQYLCNSYQTSFEPCCQQSVNYGSYMPEIENIQYQIPYNFGDQCYQQTYGISIPEQQHPQIPYGQCYQQPQYISGAGCPPHLQAIGEPVILVPENNCGVKYVPPISCDCANPYPYLPPIIIINNDDDDDNDLFGFDGYGGGTFGWSQFLALYLALQSSSSDGNPFTSLIAPPPPPPPPPPPANWGSQNCQCCCCQNCNCGSDSNDANSNSSNRNSSSNRGTTTHITIVLPKSWGVSQNSN